MLSIAGFVYLVVNIWWKYLVVYLLNMYRFIKIKLGVKNIYIFIFFKKKSFSTDA